MLYPRNIAPLLRGGEANLLGGEISCDTGKTGAAHEILESARAKKTGFCTPLRLRVTNDLFCSENQTSRLVA